MSKGARFESSAEAEKHVSQSALNAHKGLKFFYPRDYFVVESEGDASIGKPIVLGEDGKIDVSVIPLNELTEDSGFTSGDFLMYYDTVDGALYKVDYDDLPGGSFDISALSEDSGAKSGDFFVYYDTDDTTHYKIDFDDMPSGSGLWTQGTGLIYFNTANESVVIGGTTASSKMSNGLLIDQGADDDEILAFRSSDVSHGMTTYVDDDVFAFVKKRGAVGGGYEMTGVSSASQTVLIGAYYTTGLTGKTYTDAAPVEILTAKISGTAYGAVGSTDNVFRVVKRGGSQWESVMMVDAAGDLYIDGEIRTWGGGAPNQRALYCDTSNNFFSGYQCGEALVSSQACIGIGYQALAGALTGNNNIGLGYRAGVALTGGYQNTLIGHDAGEALTSGYRNIIMGEESGESVTDCDGTILLGYRSAFASTTISDFSILIGYEVGQTTTTIGIGNVWIGFRCAQNTTGTYNTLLGYQAGYLAGNGMVDCVIIGANAGINVEGANNTIVGSDAGDNVTSGTDNVFVGYQAGNIISTGSDNIFIGSGAYGANTSSNQIGIGKGVVTTGANQIIIGNSSHVSFEIHGVPSGATQAAAGAGADELWVTSSHASLPDNVLMLGV